MSNKDNQTNKIPKASSKRFETFLRRKSSYRIPKQATTLPYSELKRANNKH